MQALSAVIYMSYFTSVLYIVLGLPLALNWVKPNAWYGIRIKKTFESLDAWYSVNSLGGKAFIVAGVASLVMISLLHRYWSVDLLVKALVMISIPLVLVVVGIIYAIKEG